MGELKEAHHSSGGAEAEVDPGLGVSCSEGQIGQPCHGDDSEPVVPVRLRCVQTCIKIRCKLSTMSAFQKRLEALALEHSGRSRRPSDRRNHGHHKKGALRSCQAPQAQLIRLITTPRGTSSCRLYPRA
jgi:hypothetical protein